LCDISSDRRAEINVYTSQLECYRVRTDAWASSDNGEKNGGHCCSLL